MHPSTTLVLATRATLFLALTLALGGCAGEQAGEERVVQGECRTMYGAEVCAWHRMAGDQLAAFGITVPMQVADSAPADAPMAWPPVVGVTIPLSPTVKAAGFDNVTLYWEPHGHPPGPYLVPHFDFHFNTVTTAEREAVDCADSTKPTRLPDAYELPDVDIPGLGMLVGLCVPQMGMHALPSSDLAAGTPFEHTMIVGYYGGRPIFVEPMVTRGALLGRRSFPIAVPRVPDGQPGVRYPAEFVAQYDSAARSYNFVFSNFGAGTTP